MCSSRFDMVVIKLKLKSRAVLRDSTHLMSFCARAPDPLRSKHLVFYVLYGKGSGQEKSEIEEGAPKASAECDAK